MSFPNMEAGPCYVHLRLANGRFDSRLQKQARTAIDKAGFARVEVIAKRGRQDVDLPPEEFAGPGIRVQRVNIGTIPGTGMLRWAAGAIRRTLKTRPAVISAHHVNLLPIGYVLKVLTGAKLVYDAHELETESASLVGKPFAKFTARLFEALLISKCDQVIVVNEPIADWYRAKYKIDRVVAIHNSPRYKAPVCSNYLRKHFDIPSDKKVLIYQGVLGFGRGLPLVIDIFERGLVPGAVMVFLGFGDFEQEIRRIAEHNPAIKLHRAVPSEEMQSITASADLGIHLAEPICLSYELSLPNKLFEYVMAGVPPIVSANLPAMRMLVEDEALGFAVGSTAEVVAAELNRICSLDLSAQRAACLEAAKRYCWETDEARLVDIYLRLLGAT